MHKEIKFGIQATDAAKQYVSQNYHCYPRTYEAADDLWAEINIV